MENSIAPSPDEYLQIMRADSIPEGMSWLWYVKKAKVESDTIIIRNSRFVEIPAGNYTFLHRITDATIHHDPPGECVMEDTPVELKTHLGFVIHARGRVLVTGLGLGCVTRGLLANPNVEHVTVIENSKDVLKLVLPSMLALNDRLDVIEADAFEWVAKNKDHYDCGWHDLWTNRSAGEPHLDIWHTRLLMNCKTFIRNQGAWAYNKLAKRKLMRRGFQWIG